MKKNENQKQQVQVLWETGTKTAKMLNKKTKVPLSTIYRWVEKLKKGQNLDRMSYPSRKKKITKSTKLKIIKSLEDQKQLSLRKIAKNHKVSHESARKSIQEAQYKCVKKIKKAKLSYKHKQTRLVFANSKIDYNWQTCFFTDESSIWLSKSVPQGRWILENEGEHNYQARDIITEGKQGQKIHLWGGISYRASTKLEIFEINMNTQLYIKILKKRKKDMDQLYPNGYVFQQDGNLCHKSKSATKFIQKNISQVLDWPPNSPDLSPIENIWGWLKNEIANYQPNSIAELKNSALKHWKKLTPKFIQPYINSMKERIYQVIKGEGERTNY